MESKSPANGSASHKDGAAEWLNALRPSLCARLGLDLQRHRELHRRMRRIHHHSANQRDRRLDLGVRHLKNEFVMHLQKHLRGKPLFIQRRLHPHHRAADDVGSRTPGWAH